MVKKKLKKSEEGLGVSGFTLGVLSIVLAGWLGAIIAIVGFSFCKVQQKRHPISLSRTGITLNIIGFILSIALIVLMYYTATAAV